MPCCGTGREEQVSLLRNQHGGSHNHKQDVDEDTNDAVDYPLFLSHRLLVCSIAFLGACCAFGSQALVGASLLLMIRHDDVSVNVTSPNSSNVPVGTTELTSHHNASEWHYSWDESTKGWLTSSYFVGYYVMQVPVGWLVGRWGGYQLVLKSGAVNVLCQALAIWIPHFGPWPFAALLFLTGMANACGFPALYAVTAKWCPPAESSRLMSIVSSGVSIGIASVYAISAGAARIQLMGGWPFNFISIIAMQIVFLLFWAFLVTNTPGENKFTKASEVNYITRRITKTAISRKPTPWRTILTSPPVYAIAASLFGADFLIYTMVTVFPEYFVTVRRINKSLTSMVSGLPWFICPLLSYLVSQCVDVLRQKQCLPTIALRKVCDVIAKPLVGLLLLFLSFLPEDYVTSASALYALSIFLLMGFQNCSWVANMAEMTPDYAGEVFIIAQLCSMTGPCLVPPVFAALTPTNSASEWQLCFGITLAVCVVTSLIYILLASSQHQNWDEAKKTDDKIPVQKSTSS